MTDKDNDVQYSDIGIEQNMLEFAKMVKGQLKKEYDIDARSVSEKPDAHGQERVILKIGPKDFKGEFWFRKSDDGLAIDYILDNKFDRSIDLSKPLCHLRTSASMAAVELPKLDKSEPTKDPESSEDSESSGNSENSEIVEGVIKDIVDAVITKIADITGEDWDDLVSVLLNDPDDFIQKYGDKLDNDMLLKLKTITGNIAEGMSVLSHDNRLNKKLRKTVPAIQHMKGKKEKIAGRMPNPVKQAVDGVKRKNPVRNNKRSMKENNINDSAMLIKTIICDGEAVLEDLNRDRLDFVVRVMKRMSLYEEVSSDIKRKVGTMLERAESLLNDKAKNEAQEFMEYVQWLRTENRSIRKNLISEQK